MNRLILCAVLLAVVSPLHQNDASKAADQQQQSASPQHNSRRSMGAEERQKPNIQPQQCSPKQKANIPVNTGPDYTLWALVVNGVLTLITLGIAIAAVSQAIAAKDAAEIALNAQRSWVISERVDSPDFTNPWFQHIACHFKIIGKSPVRIMESNFRIRLVDAKVTDDGTNAREPDLPKHPDYKDPYTLENQPEMGRIRPPGEDFRVVPMLESLFLFEDGKDADSGAEDVKAIKSRDKFLCAYGFIRYRDAFSRSKVRETKFCYVYRVDQGTSPKRSEAFEVGGPPAYNEVT